MLPGVRLSMHETRTLHGAWWQSLQNLEAEALQVIHSPFACTDGSSVGARTDPQGLRFRLFTWQVEAYAYWIGSMYIHD